MVNMLNNGIRIRWINTAGFELVLPSGAHMLFDPWLDESDVFPLSLDEIEQADYILLSHVHFDHAQSIERILVKFPKAKLFVGDLSINALCQEQRVSLTNIYRVRNGDEYTFNDINLRVFGGRHTENSKGVYRPKEFSKDLESLDSLTGYYGSLELQNYLVTTNDGFKFFIWGGQTTEDQKYRIQGLHPDVAAFHLSPKQDPYAFAELVKYCGAKFVVPHHHDLTQPLFDKHPELVDIMLPPEAKEAYLIDGKFSQKKFVSRYEKAVKDVCPTTTMMELVHHKWYHFGLAYETEE